MAQAKTGKWSGDELRYLVENAGRVSKRTICRRLRRRPEEVEAVAARVRATGYPISLEVETCPMCGRRAPLVYTLGICKPCQYRMSLERVRGQTDDLLRRISPEDRKTYMLTETRLGGYIREDRPRAAPAPEDATPAERAEHEDAQCKALADWEARCLYRQLRAAQKRKERVASRATAGG